MTPILAFKIKTIPDIAGIRLIHALPADLPDYDVAEFAFQRQRAKNGCDDLPSHLQQIIAISCVSHREGQGIEIFTLGDKEEGEASILNAFFERIFELKPQLVSWDGADFDLPILRCRALKHGIKAPSNLIQLDRLSDKSINQDALFHTDLSRILMANDSRASVPLGEMAKLSGFPGEMNKATSKTWDDFQAQRLQSICENGEIEVLNLFLLFQRFGLISGELTLDAYQAEMARTRAALKQIGARRWFEFLAAWLE